MKKWFEDPCWKMSQGNFNNPAGKWAVSMFLNVINVKTYQINFFCKISQGNLNNPGGSGRCVSLSLIPPPALIISRGDEGDLEC